MNLFYCNAENDTLRVTLSILTIKMTLVRLTTVRMTLVRLTTVRMTLSRMTLSTDTLYRPILIGMPLNCQNDTVRMTLSE